MSSELMTVEATAALLQLHPKTVLRFIREGRLRANKVGKQYRILRSDLHAFTGSVSAQAHGKARVTCIVDIDQVDAVLLQRLTAMLIGASKRNDPSGTPVSLDIAHDSVRGSTKVIVIASPADAAALLELLDACLEA